MFTAKELNTRSNELVSVSRNLDKELHKHLCNIVEFITSEEANGNILPATHIVEKLFNKGQTSVRVDSITTWFAAFAPITWTKGKDNQKDGFKLNPNKLADFNENRQASLKSAKAMPFYKFTKAKVESAFDLDAAIAALVKKAEEKQGHSITNAKGEKVDHKVSADKLASLKALIAA